MRLFADDSIIYREIKNICDHALLQQDLISLCDRAETWQLNFNISKCYHLGVTNKVVPFSHNHLIYIYIYIYLLLIYLLTYLFLSPSIIVYCFRSIPIKALKLSF